MTMKMRIIYFAVLALGLSFVTSTKSVAAAETWEVTQVTSEGSQQNGPVLSGDVSVWKDFRGPQGTDIWGYNHSTNTEFPVVQELGNQSVGGFHGNDLVYNSFDPDSGINTIWLLNIVTGAKTEIASGTDIGEATDMDSNWVVYVIDGAAGPVMAYKRSTGITTEITEHGSRPRVSNNKVVWDSGFEVLGYDLTTNTPITVAAGDGEIQQLPEIHGDIVVWQYGNGPSKLMMKNLATGEVTVEHETPAGIAISYPTLNDPHLTWRQAEPIFDGGSQASASIQNVWVKNITTGEKTQLTDYPQGQVSPASVPSIFGNRIVWHSWITGNGDIYQAELAGVENVDVRDLLKEIIALAKQGKKDKLLKGYETANITRPAQHALRDLKIYEQRLSKGREEAARDRLESFFENLDEIDEALEVILEKPGREELVAVIRELLEKIREHSPSL